MAEGPASRKLSKRFGLAVGAQGKALWGPLRSVLANYCLARTSVELFFEDELEVEPDRVLCCVPEEYSALRSKAGGKTATPEPPGPGEYLIWADRLPQGFLGVLCASDPVGARTALARFADSLLFPGSKTQQYVRVPNQEARGEARPLVFLIDWLDSYEAFAGWTKEDWRLFLYTKLQEGADELLIKPFAFTQWDTGSPLHGLKPTSPSERSQWKTHTAKLDDLLELAGELDLPLGFRVDPQLAFPLALTRSTARSRTDVACLAEPRDVEAAFSTWQSILGTWAGLSGLLFAPGLEPRCQCSACQSAGVGPVLDLATRLVEAFGGPPGVDLALTLEGLVWAEQQQVFALLSQGKLAWCKRLLLPYSWAYDEKLLASLPEHVEVVSSVDVADPTGRQLAAPPILGELVASMPPSSGIPRPEACARLEERVKLTGRVALRSSRTGEQFNLCALGRALKWPELSPNDVTASFLNLHLTKFDLVSFRKHVLKVERLATGLIAPSAGDEAKASSLKSALTKPSKSYEVVSWQGSLLLWTVAGALKTSTGLYEARQELATLAHRLATATPPEQDRLVEETLGSLSKLARRKSLLGSDLLKPLLPGGSINKLVFDIYTTDLNRDSLDLTRVATEARGLARKAGPRAAVDYLVPRLRGLAGIGNAVVSGGIQGGKAVEGGIPVLLSSGASAVASPLLNCTASAWGEPVCCRLPATKGRECCFEVAFPWDGRQPTIRLSAEGQPLAEVQLAANEPTWRQFAFTPQAEELVLEFAPTQPQYCPCFCWVALLPG